MTPSLSDLPGINRWGAKRIEKAISFKSATGALLGVVFSPILLLSARFLASLFRQLWGWPLGHVGFVLGWVVSGYLALLVLANWQTIETAADE